MTEEQGKDSIEHLRRVVEGMAHDMIAKAGGVEKVGGHRIIDAVIRRLFAFGAGSNESDRLSRAFVKAAVQSICAEEELRQRFRTHPQEKLYYEQSWDKL